MDKNFSDSSGIPTHNLQIRSLFLYAVEIWSQILLIICLYEPFDATKVRTFAVIPMWLNESVR